MSNYLRYLLKKRFPIIVALAAISTLICFITTANTSLIYTWDDKKYSVEGILLVFTITLCTLATIVPLFEFSFKMNKVSCDQAYSLPIKRWQLYMSRFIIGYIEVIIPFTLAYFLSFLNIICRENLFVMWPFFVYYPAMLLSGLLCYSIVCFVYCETNTAIDGFVTVSAITVVGAIFVMPICEIIFNVSRYNAYDFSIYQVANVATTILDQELIGISSYQNEYPTFWIGLGIFTFLGIAALVGFFFRANYYRSEDTLQKSESFLSYRVLIPLYGVCLSLLNANVSIILAFALVGTYLGYALYRRSFKLDKRHWIIFAIVSVVEILAGMVAYIF